MSLCRIHEFSKVADVTVRTLHHYDRLGLLKPRRTNAGYRLYGLQELERLEQVVALKFLGLPLKQIKTLLDQDLLQLPNALRLQRAALHEKREFLDRAISAIQDAERMIQRGKPADAKVLSAIITALKRQDRTEFMKKYFSDQAWAKWNAHKKQLSREAQRKISLAWVDLYRDAEDLLDEDPAGEKAQEFLKRWVALTNTTAAGDREIKAGFTKAWFDHKHWPAEHQRRIAKFNVEKIAEFIGKAMAGSMKKYYSEEAWAKMVKRRDRSAESRRRAWRGWLDLFRDVEASLGEDPASKTAQALAKRWLKLAKDSTGGDAAIKTGLRKAWLDRQHWPDAMREQLAPFNFDKIVPFIGKAIARRAS
jgi:DNA-binding transcriptional MerR regulator